MVVCKRIYEPSSSKDGYRVLIDRLWPRGVKREEAAIKEWLKELAPSSELRRLATTDKSKWAEFQRRYRMELSKPELQPTLERLRKIARSGTLTLLYAKRDTQHNNAVVLKEVLEEGL
nr:MAG: hypothetical protein DIU57_08325 [Pseudomonadota bacterium]